MIISYIKWGITAALRDGRVDFICIISLYLCISGICPCVCHKLVKKKLTNMLSSGSVEKLIKDSFVILMLVMDTEWEIVVVS